MKRLISSLLLVIVLSSFFVAGSEINVDFTRDNKDVNVEEYVPKGDLWSDYGNYIGGVLVVLIIIFVMLKIKSKKKTKKVSKKKFKKVVKRVKKIKKGKKK